MAKFSISKVPPAQLALFIIFTVSGTLITGAMVIEHGLGYVPCQLCYEQRTGHYIAIALAFIGLVLTDKPKWNGLPLVLVLAWLALLHADLLALYHTGIEQDIFEGPSSCANALSLMSENLDTLDLNTPETSKLVSCSKPALKIFDLSLAAWNAVLTTLILIISGMLAYKQVRSTSK